MCVGVIRDEFIFLFLVLEALWRFYDQTDVFISLIIWLLFSNWMTEFYLVCEWLYEHFVPIGGQFDQNLVTQSKKKC